MLPLALILILGISAQWLAWRIRVPSILLLLLFGFFAGPAEHWIDPDALLGDLLLPLVSLSVALILFEGGMSLRLAEIREVRGVVRNLVGIGALATGLVTAVAAHFFLHMPWGLAALTGAILLVTGPTVIGPLLRHVRPASPLGSILKWEGIVIDPIGAMAAVLMFEAVGSPSIGHAVPVIVTGVIKTLVVGGVLGAGFGLILVQLLRRHYVPDHLHSPLALMAVASALVCANGLQPESGLLAVTTMGIVIANQKSVIVQHIVEFKETLSVLLISGLFIVLAARVKLESIISVGWGGLWFLAALVLIGRPLSVFISTIGSGFSWRQKAFLAAMAPRGIVAAAVASVFAIRLRASGMEGADKLVPVTFLVIVGTVLIYGLTAAPIGKWLGVAFPHAQGCLIVGAHPLARAIGEALRDAGISVLLIDTNRWNIQQARLEGLSTFLGSVVSHDVESRIELDGIGRLLAMTSNDEVNSLAALHFARRFSRSEVFQIATGPVAPTKAVSQELRGRPLFGESQTLASLSEHLRAGATIRKTLLSETFGIQQFMELNAGRTVPLFVLSPTGELTIVTGEEPLAPRPGQTLISLTDPAPPKIEKKDEAQLVGSAAS